MQDMQKKLYEFIILIFINQNDHSYFMVQMKYLRVVFLSHSNFISVHDIKLLKMNYEQSLFKYLL